MMPRLAVGLTTLGLLTGVHASRKSVEELRHEAEIATVNAPQKKSEEGVDLSSIFLGGLAGASAAAGINITTNAIGRRRCKRPEIFQAVVETERSEPVVDLAR